MAAQPAPLTSKFCELRPAVELAGTHVRLTLKHGGDYKEAQAAFERLHLLVPSNTEVMYQV